MNRKSLLKKIIGIVLIGFVFSGFSFAFDCSTHTNGDSGDITYSGSTTSYDSVYCLDSSDLTGAYETLHTTGYYNSGVAFVISEDLNFSAANLNYATLNENLGFGTGNDTWLPIGGRGTFSAAGLTNFNADFYGSGNTIKVGNIDYSNDVEVGFFGYIASQGAVYELNLEVGNVNGGNNNNGFVGGFLGFNDGGTIENSSIVVNFVSGNEDLVGGFVGQNNAGTIKNSLAVVNNVSGGDNRVGGFVGNIYSGTIENSSVVGGNINGSGDNVGGFVGKIWDKGTIKRSSVIVNLVNGNNKVGGFVGHNDDGTIENSSIVGGNVSGSGEDVGGFVGYNRPGTIKNSSAVVNLISGNNNVGGFVGDDYNPTYSGDVSRVLDLSGSSDVARDFYTKGGGTKDTYNKEEFFFNDAARDNDGLSTVVGSGDITITVPKNIQYSDTNVYSGGIEDKVDEFKANFYDKYEVTFSETNGLSGVDIEVNEENLTTNSSGETTIQLKDGNYNFTGTKDGYKTYTTGFDVNGTGKTVEFEMEKVIGADFVCTSENDGTYSGTNYDTIFCLDSSDLTGAYEVLHVTGNYDNTTAFVLSGDLNFSGANLNYATLNENLGFGTGNDTWLPIGGNFDSAGGSTAFNADFYGSGNTIKVNDINYSSDYKVGFFGYIGSEGNIYELNLEINNIIGNQDVGGFVGGNDNGTIENSSIVLDTVSLDSSMGGGSLGGFVGGNDNGTIKNSSVIVNSVSGDDSTSKVGGFVGRHIFGTIENSSVIVSSVSGYNEVGGFVGTNYQQTIKKSSVIVDSVSGNQKIGGFIGKNNYGTIENSSSVVSGVSGSSEVGGFVGHDNSGTYSGDVARVLNLDGNSGVSRNFYATGGATENTYNKEEFFFNDASRDNDGLSTATGGGNITITVPKNIQYSSTSLYSGGIEDKVDKFKANFYDKYEVKFSEINGLSGVNIEVDNESLNTSSTGAVTTQLKNGSYNFTGTKQGYKIYTTGFDVSGTGKILEFEMQKSPEFYFTISDQILKADEEQKTIPLNAKLILNGKEIEGTEYSYEVYSGDSIKDNLKIENKQLVITGLNQTGSYDIAIQVTGTASNI